MWYKLVVLRRDKEDKRSLPGADGSLVKNKTHFFKELMYNKFWEPKPEFDYLSFETPKMFDQDAWVLLDAHIWKGEYPNKIRSFVISKNIKELFENFIIIASTFYPAKLEFKGAFYDYFVFHTLDNGWGTVVDFGKSIFTEWNLINMDKLGPSKFKIKSTNDIFEKNRELNLRPLKPNETACKIGPDKIVFKQKLDLVLLPHLFWVISQRLKDAIESAGITGVEMTPIENVEFVGGQ